VGSWFCRKCESQEKSTKVVSFVFILCYSSLQDIVFIIKRCGNFLIYVGITVWIINLFLFFPLETKFEAHLFLDLAEYLWFYLLSSILKMLNKAKNTKLITKSHTKENILIQL
jgi:hypothetical protein